MPSGKEKPPMARAEKRAGGAGGSSSSRQWVMLLPETATDLPKKPDAGPLFTRLPHPSTGQAALYLFGSDACQIFELKAFHEEYRSWFISQEVQCDGRLFFATPVDPLFLVLFYLMKAEKEQGKFQPLDQVLVDEEFSSSMQLLQCTSTSQSIHHIAEQKEIGGKKYFRYSEKKTLTWLNKKVNQLVKVLKENNIPVGGKVQAATFISNVEAYSGTEEDYIRYAHGLISEYIPEELSATLANYLRLPQGTDLPIEPASKKRKLSDGPVEAEEDYTKFNTGDLKNKKMFTARSGEGSQKRAMTIDMKLEIIRKHGEGKRVIDLAKEYGRNKSTIGTILRQKEVLMASKPAKGLSIISKRRSNVNDEMENLLLIWLRDKQLSGDSVSDSVIREKAKVIYEDLMKSMPENVTGSFKASRGWFEKFKVRTGIHSVVRHREAVSLDAKCVEEFVVTFAELVNAEGYVAQQIFNCNETGLFWKKMPRRTFITAEEMKMPGHKPMKDRLTLALCANASGDCKVKPLLVYHSETPRAFKAHRVIKETLPVLWRSSPKAWVTRNIFVQWVNLVFGPTVKNFLQENNLPLKALLVLDNAPAHPPNLVDDILEEFKFIDVLFLPPDITPLLQPMDQQVISNFKKIYTKNLFKQCFEVTESTNLTLREFWKDHYNIATCLSLIDLSWQGVSRRTLNSAWKKLWPEAVSDRTFEWFQQPESVILEDIVSLGKFMGLEVNEDDINDLVEEHSQELTTEELKELQQQQQQSEVLKAWEEELAEKEEETASRDIKKMLSMWEKLRNFVEKKHPEKVATVCVADLFNDMCLTHFRNILRERNNQTPLERFLVKRLPHDESDGHQEKKRRLSESEDEPDIIQCVKIENDDDEGGGPEASGFYV